ncbi:MAG: hypothetical protein ACETWG_02205 [Candidatus Neomarinimicrobiota bacterium]
MIFGRTFGGRLDEVGHSMLQTFDGGFVIVGMTGSYGAGSNDVWLIKISAAGEEEWNRTYGGTLWDEGFSVQQTADSGYVITGITESYGAGDYDVWLIKLNAEGSEEWTRTFGGGLWDGAASVCQTSDGGYILTGYTDSFGEGPGDVWLIKTDSDGREVWNRTYGGSGWDGGRSVLQTSEGGYIVAGYTESYRVKGYDVWLLKVEASGDTIWSRTHGGRGTNMAHAVAHTADGGYIIAGRTDLLGTAGYDALLIKTDPEGKEVWTRTFGGDQDDLANSVQQTSDNGFIIVGYTYSYGAGMSDIWLIKTDAEGTESWTRTYGEAYRDVGHSALQTADSGYVIVGNTESFSAGDYDIWFIRTNAEGNPMGGAE